MSEEKVMVEMVIKDNGLVQMKGVGTKCFVKLFLVPFSIVPFVKGVNKPRCDEDSIELKELMVLCSKLSNRVLALEQSKTAQDLVIKKLQKKVKRIERKIKARTLRMILFKIGNFKRKRLYKENFPVIHQPPQETSIKILHDQENKINSMQTFLRKFNRISFFETPKVLLLAWDRVFKIKDALGNKQYKPEDIQELFRELLNDVQNIHEELAEYIDTLSWNRPVLYNNDDDNDEDCTIAITHDFSITDSLSIGDEHLDTEPKFL
nr:hypothetical protein [Tanacetum cinerariifolium]